MTMRVLATLVIVCCVSGAPAFYSSAQDSPPPAPPAPPAGAVPSGPADKATGLAAWERLKGNTIEGKIGGDAFAEYFGPDGGVKYVDKDGLSTGTWAVQKNKVCFDFPDDDDRSCSNFEVTGSAGLATDDDGSVVRFQILTGNVKSL